MDEAQGERVQLERELLAESLKADFRDPREREILSRPDPLGLGSAR